jgi:flagellar FliL protein
MADEAQKPKEEAVKKAGAPGVMVLAAIMVGGAFLSSFLTAKFISPGAAAPAASQAGKDPASLPKDKAKTVTTFYKLGEFIVNLANKEATRYLKTDITIEIVDSKDVEKLIKEKEAMYRDAIIQKLSEYSTQQLGTPDGKEKMKQDLIAAISGLDTAIKVVNLYFNSLMMQ